MTLTLQGLLVLLHEQWKPLTRCINLIISSCIHNGTVDAVILIERVTFPSTCVQYMLCQTFVDNTRALLHNTDFCFGQTNCH